MSSAAWLEVEVSEVVAVTDRVKRFRLVPAGDGWLPAWAPGAHILVALSDGASTWRNAYSLVGSPSDQRSYQISVLRTEYSRGGSRYLHEGMRPGQRIAVSQPVNLFPMASLARKHVLVAGGIGITPFLSMMETMHARSIPFELHYAVRSRKNGAYVAEICRAYGVSAHVYETGTGPRPAVHHILCPQPLGTHLYVCGPERMIEDVLLRAREAGWPEDHLHSERFVGGSAGKGFSVTLARSGQSVHVHEHQSLLEALEGAGVDAPFLCRGGSCGQCETAVLECQTALLHNDHYLSSEERQSGSKIMICVSRADGGNLVLDL